MSQQLKAAYPGFIISAPPVPWNTSDQQLCVTMLQAGALDYCAPQYYDGPNLADPSWILPNVDVWMGLIPRQNFVFGFGIDPNLSNYETIAVGISVWQSISAKYPCIGGAFDWQIDEDLLNGAPCSVNGYAGKRDRYQVTDITGVLFRFSFLEVDHPFGRSRGRSFVLKRKWLGRRGSRRLRRQSWREALPAKPRSTGHAR